MQYLVRIEMHYEGRDAYTRLHNAEVAEGFSHTFTAEATGLRRGVPTGVCWMETPNDAYFVLDAAKRAVLPIDPNAMIVVAGGPQIVFHGYPKATIPVGPLAAMLRLAPLPTAPALRPLVPSAPRSAFSTLLTSPEESPASISSFLAALNKK